MFYNQIYGIYPQKWNKISGKIVTVYFNIFEIPEYDEMNTIS